MARADLAQNKVFNMFTTMMINGRCLPLSARSRQDDATLILFQKVNMLVEKSLEGCRRNHRIKHIIIREISSQAALVSQKGPREPRCAFFVEFGLYSAHNSTRRPPRENRENEICDRRGKEREILGGPEQGADTTFGPNHFWPAHFSTFGPDGFLAVARKPSIAT